MAERQWRIEKSNVRYQVVVLVNHSIIGALILNLPATRGHIIDFTGPERAVTKGATALCFEREGIVED